MLKTHTRFVGKLVQVGAKQLMLDGPSRLVGPQALRGLIVERLLRVRVHRDPSVAWLFAQRCHRPCAGDKQLCLRALHFARGQHDSDAFDVIGELVGEIRRRGQYRYGQQAG